MIDLNVRALVTLTHALLPPMLARGRGAVLNVASTAAFQPGPYMAVYYASKAFVLHFSEALHEEVKGAVSPSPRSAPGRPRPSSPMSQAWPRRRCSSGLRVRPNRWCATVWRRWSGDRR